PPPAGADSVGWRRWWDESAPTWTEAQRERAWDLLDRVRFAEVEARPAGRTAFVLLRVWQFYNDEWNTTNESITAAHRTREGAERGGARLRQENEAERAHRQALRQAREDGDEDDGEEDYEDDLPEYRVIEIDVEGL